VFTWVTRLFDTSTTVTGTVSPSSVNRRIMPTLRPSNPRELLRLILLLRYFRPGRCNWQPGLVCERRLINLCPLRTEPQIITRSRSVPQERVQTAFRRGLLQLDFHVHAGRQVQLHQRVHGLVGRVDDVHQALVRADLELVAGRLVHVRRTQDVEALHARGQGHGALDDRTGALGGVDDLSGGLVDQLVIEGLQANADFLLGGHSDYSMIFATTPAPTVLPPSRMAKRRPSSMAMGAISLTVMDTLSPGMTISLSLGSSMAPVTSVVRK